MNHNKITKNEQNTKEPNYKARRAVAGLALVAAGAGIGIASHETIKNNTPQHEPTLSNIEDTTTPYDLTHDPVTINDGENIVVVSVKEASELRGLPENELQQPVTARILEEQKAETIPKITHAGDKVTVRYDPNSDQYDIDVIVNPENEN